jgi:hypothetical protein
LGLCEVGFAEAALVDESQHGFLDGGPSGFHQVQRWRTPSERVEGDLQWTVHSALRFCNAKTPPGKAVREGTRGASLHPTRPAHTPQHQLFGKATPGPPPSLRPANRPDVRTLPRAERSPAAPLDKQRGLVRLAFRGLVHVPRVGRR